MSEFSPQTQAAKKPEFPPPRIIREDFLPGKQTRCTMPELSSQAQVVIDAYRSSHLSINNLAAALRAAALYCKQDRIRLLAIAHEIENQ